MISSSLREQYGLNTFSKKFKKVTWNEFTTLLTGISPDSILGRVVLIRAETDPDTIKNFNLSQRKIYNDWQNRKIKNMSKSQLNKALDEILNIFKGVSK